ncbi:hypothetical protein DPMN_147399 [Dreissena polymorpha]|uniref:Uncharacterized protein n=1 Tax=Dreissena polymorpha TaxID=45954 RepID=A0A9D4F9S7_DREPO|nr:hypothetical protein DPMN_147399 [Dreissena polymorpha]
MDTANGLTSVSLPRRGCNPERQTQGSVLQRSLQIEIPTCCWQDLVSGKQSPGPGGWESILYRAPANYEN